MVTEPDFPYVDAISPFQPLQMKVVHCPIDTSLNFTQATKLIRELKPGTLVIPENYTRNPQATSQRTDLLIDVVRSNNHNYKIYIIHKIYLNDFE